MERLLRRLADLGTSRPRAVLLAAALVTAGALAYTALAVHIQTDLFTFLPDTPEIRAFADAREIAREPGTLHVLLEAPEGADGVAGREPGAALLEHAEAFARALRETDLVASVDYALPPVYERFVREVLSRYGFLYLEGADLDEALARLEPAAIHAAIEAAAARLRTAAPVQLARLTAADPLGLIALFSRRLTQGLGAFRIDASSGFLLAADRRALLVKVVGRGRPSDLAYGRRLMGGIESALAAAAAIVPGVRAGCTGGYAFAIEDERSIARDIYVTVSTSVVTVLGIFVLAFRRARAFVHASAPLAVGIAVGVAAFVVLRGEVTVASAAFVSVVIGLAVDFPIHLYARYLRERQAGATVAAANAAAVVSAGGGAVAAGLMTGAAFASLALTGFRGLADLGIMAATCMVASLAASLVLFPALTGAARAREETRGTAGFGLAVLWRAVVTAPRAILVGSAAATVAAGAFLLAAPGGRAVVLDSDLHSLRPKGAKALEVQERIAERFGGGLEVALAIVRAPDEQAALARLAAGRAALERLRARGVILGWESPERYLPPAASQEAARARLLAVDPARVEADLRAALAAAKFKVAALDGAIATLREQLRPPSLVTRALLEERGLGEVVRHLEPAARGREVRALVTIFPPAESAERGDGALRAALAEALDAPGPGRTMVTGITAVVGALVARLERDFAAATLASVALVFLIALVHFREARAAILATLPVAIGFVWMLAIMRALSVPINFMNVIVFPMVIGIEDNGVHIIHRYRELRARGVPAGAPAVQAALGDTGLALFLCTTTTMLGFGSLVLSLNPGLASIGAATIVAKAACWITGTVALPAWLAWRGK